MKITEKDVRYVADLAHLELSAAERKRMETDLNSILEYVDHLAEADTTAVEPMTQVQSIAAENADFNSLRNDELRSCLPREEALKNAPQTDGAFFRVPKVIDR